MNIAALQTETRETMPADLASLEAWFDRRLDERLAQREAAKVPGWPSSPPRARWTWPIRR
jgi:hypothetical protein